MKRLWLIAGLLAAAAGCVAVGDEGPWPIEGSTWRLGEPEPSDKGEVKIDVFANRTDCRNAAEVDESEIESCIPRVDRGTGQVSLSFRLIDKKSDNVMFLPLSQSGVDLAHLGSPRPEAEWELIQHGPMRAGQLFIIIIDGSASIYTTGGIEKVRKALNNPAVVDAFLPEKEGETTGVMLLRFSEDVQTLDGKDPLTKGAIIESRDVYKKRVREHLISQDRGYSHVYDAVSFASTKLLEAPEVRNWLQINNASPTIVLLTDGFNNEHPKDTCGSNVSRLNSAMQTVMRARREGGAYKPTVYTVGLGRAMMPKFKVTKGTTITEVELCGRYADEKIDGHLEEVGIDNPSLAWLADVGGGESFIRNNHRGLSDVFLAAAAQRYQWYELRYQVDSFYHRRSFDTRLRLKSYAQAETKVWFHPSAWMDAPSGTVAENERWFTATPFRRSLFPVMTILGGLVLVSFVGPATFNARRALFRRAKRK